MYYIEGILTLPLFYNMFMCPASVNLCKVEYLARVEYTLVDRLMTELGYIVFYNYSLSFWPSSYVSISCIIKVWTRVGRSRRLAIR